MHRKFFLPKLTMDLFRLKNYIGILKKNIALELKVNVLKRFFNNSPGLTEVIKVKWTHLYYML